MIYLLKGIAKRLSYEQPFFMCIFINNEKEKIITRTDTDLNAGDRIRSNMYMGLTCRTV